MRRTLGLAALAALVPGSAALAAGLMRSQEGDLAISAQTLRVSVEGTFATTEVVQTFENGSDHGVEAVYDFQLPPHATFSGLSIWVGGKEVQGEVVSRARAEEVYSEVTGVQVAKPEEKASAARELRGTRPEESVPLRWQPSFKPSFRRDPALLEARSGGELRLRVAPVPAHGTERVRIRYVEPVTVESGRGHYVFPAAKGAPLDAEVLVRGKVERASSGGLASEELIHGEAVRLAGKLAHAPGDVDVSWNVAPEDAPTIDVTAGGGSALLALTPRLPAMALLPRDMVLVLDASAVEGKGGQARVACLEKLLGELRLQDRFDLVSFNLAARSFAGRLVPASAPAREQARAFLEAVRFEHASDPRTALSALAKVVRATESPRPLDLVFVTGAGFSRSDELVREVERAALEAGVRVFAIEIAGEGAPSAPLARLCERTGGAAARDTSEIVRLLRAPALRAPSLRLEGVELEDVSPAATPRALRDGTPVTIVGRVKKAGAGRAFLEGTLADGRRMSWTIPFELPAKGNVPDVDRLRAQGMADQLLAALAAKDLEATERARLERELARVSLEGKILTRATSLLVLESAAMFEEFGISRENEARLAEERAAQAERRAELDRAIEAQRREAERQGEVVARADTQPLWSPPRLGIGGGHGGGAAGPVFLVLALVLAALAFRR